MCLLKILEPIKHEYGDLMVDPQTERRLIVVDSTDRLQAMAQIVEQLDQPAVVGGELKVFPVEMDVYEVLPNLVPLLTRSGEPERAALYWHYPHYGNQGGFPGGGVRMGDWKLLERFEDGQIHLYNLKNDLGERNDLASEHPDRAAAMRDACSADSSTRARAPDTTGALFLSLVRFGQDL